MESEKYKMLGVKMPMEMYQRLSDAAKKQERTVSSMVRVMINFFLKNNIEVKHGKK